MPVAEDGGPAAAEVAAVTSSTPLTSVNIPLFNKYELKHLIGRGAFAKVYHAVNVTNGQNVAVKVITKNKLHTNSAVHRNSITREIAIMRRVRHRHIVHLHEVLATKTKIYFVLELVRGGEMFAKVSKRRCSEDLGRKYFQQLISAVSFCHDRGVYHRDLKLENLLLDENGDLKVSDFGLGAMKEDEIRAPDGLLHTLCGTPAYLAPEILARRGYDGARSDIWSCGVVLFVLTAGYLPFDGSNYIAMYRKIYRGDFRCPSWLSPDLRRLLNRILDVNPETRITIEEIKRDPWFRDGYGAEVEFGDFVRVPAVEEKKLEDLNAFNLISFSSGLDLSGLFVAAEDVVRTTAEGSPEGVVEKVKRMVEEENGVWRLRGIKGFLVELEGQDGHFGVTLEVFLLTDSLVVVEMKRKSGDVELFSELWNDKIRPLIRVSGY